LVSKKEVSSKSKDQEESKHRSELDQLREIERQKLINQQGRSKQTKSKDQKKTLEAEYLKNPVWDFELKKKLALKLGLTFNQVQKWNWDRRKKDGAQSKKKKKN